MTEKKELIYRLRRKDTGKWWSEATGAMVWGDSPKTYRNMADVRRTASRCKQLFNGVPVEVVVFEVTQSYSFDIEEKA